MLILTYFLITFSKELKPYSSNLLKNATKTKKFCAESNFPFDKFVGMNRFSNMDRVAAAKAMEKLADDNITNLKNIYDQRRTEAVAVEEFCRFVGGPSGFHHFEKCRTKAFA